MDFRPKRNMSTFQPPPRPMLFNIGVEKPRELSMDYVAALPSQRYLYRGDNCQLLMSRQFSTDSSATPVFQSDAPTPKVMPKVVTRTHCKGSGGGLSTLTSFVGNAITGMMTSLFGPKKMTIPPPFEYQLNEQHIRGIDFSNYDKQKTLALFGSKLTPVSTPEPDVIFDGDTSDSFQRYMDTAQQAATPKVVVVEPPTEQKVEEVPEHKKRVKFLDVKPKAETSPTKSTGTSPLHSPSSFRHSHQKDFNKNRKEKARHEIALAIREDLSDQEDEVDEEPPCQAVTTSEEHAEKTETTKQTVPMLTSVTDFPAIPEPITESLQNRSSPKANKNNNNNVNKTSVTRLARSCSECDSDDNFIVFASDAVSTTPESSYTRGSPNNLSRCKSITDVLRLKRLGSAFRQRQASECSEDSFVVFADDGDERTKQAVWSDEDDDENDDSEDDSDESESASGSSSSEEESETEDEADDAKAKCKSEIVGKGVAKSEDKSEDKCVAKSEDKGEDKGVGKVEDRGESQLKGKNETKEMQDAEKPKENVLPMDSGFDEKKVTTKVQFNLVPKVNVIHAWAYAYHKARMGKWEQAARDRVRFKARIDELEKTIAPIFADQHRQRVYSQRFASEDNQTRAETA